MSNVLSYNFSILNTLTRLRRQYKKTETQKVYQREQPITHITYLFRVSYHCSGKKKTHRKA